MFFLFWLIARFEEDGSFIGQYGTIKRQNNSNSGGGGSNSFAKVLAASQGNGNPPPGTFV